MSQKEINQEVLDMQSEAVTEKANEVLSPVVEQVAPARRAIMDQTNQIDQQFDSIREQVMALAETAMQASESAGPGFFMIGLTIFVLACFVGYYVVWNVTPALHSPLMSVSNAISGVVIVGALVATGISDLDLSKWFGFIAVTLASINIFGGFAVTDRMLALFKKKN